VLIFYGLVALYELRVRHFISHRSRANKRVFEWMRYLNAFVETSTPTILIIIVASTAGPSYTLLGPVSFAYFLFIILSTLRLDFTLCVFTGFVAAVEHAILAFFYLVHFQDPALSSPLNVPIYYIDRSLLLLTGGIAAGFVAMQIKQRVLSSFKVIAERNEIINLFGQQVSPEIVDALLKQKPDPAIQKRSVCIMFLDIRNFTSFAAMRTPEEIIAYQNAVFGFMIDIINGHHGIINQFLGDGFMSTFGAPISYGNDCYNAVAAAREIIARLKHENEIGSIPPTRLGIGIHAGEVVTGNVGTSLRKQYSITGNVVILASRIEQLNKQYHSQLLISEDVWQAIGGAEDAVHLGLVQVKGEEKPVSLYRLAQ
jgi:adenylate cyclase